jgi:hypothetical protein
VGSRVGLDGCRKSRPPPGFDPRIRPYVIHIFTALMNKMPVHNNQKTDEVMNHEKCAYRLFLESTECA